MRRLTGLLLVACLAVSLAACGPIPKPFQTTEAEKLNNPLLDVRDGAGVTVVPLEAAPPAFAGSVAEGLVVALREMGVPASSSGALTNGMTVEGSVIRVKGGLSLSWRLRDQSDAIVDTALITMDRVPDGAVIKGDPALVDEAVLLSAEVLAEMLRPGSLEAEPPPPSTLFVAGVAGAPGDGNRSLDRAMKGALREADFPVVREVGDTTLSIAGNVRVTSLDDTREKIVILWTILDADGLEIGTLEQQNVIPRGQLSGRWGGIAFDIAQANLDAIAAVLEQVDADRAAAAAASNN